MEQGEPSPECRAGQAELPGGGQLGSYTSPGGDAPFHHPDTSASLRQVLTELIREPRSCIFELTSVEINVDRAGEGTVQLQDSVLVYDDPDGWGMVSPNQFELRGAACALMRSIPQPFLYVSFPDDVVVS